MSNLPTKKHTPDQFTWEYNSDTEMFTVFGPMRPYKKWTKEEVRDEITLVSEQSQAEDLCENLNKVFYLLTYPLQDERDSLLAERDSLKEELAKQKNISGGWAVLAGKTEGQLRIAIDLLGEASTANFNSNLGARIKLFIREPEKEKVKELHLREALEESEAMIHKMQEFFDDESECYLQSRELLRKVTAALNPTPTE